MSEQQRGNRGPLPGVTRVIHSVSNSPVNIGDLTQRTAEAYSIHISTFLNEEIPGVPFLVEGCIPRSCITLLTGESGAGKSFVAYDLARAVASGGSWLNRGIPLPNPETVLVLNYDNPSLELRRRIIRLGLTAEDNLYIMSQGMTLPQKGWPEMLKLPAEQARLKSVIQFRRPSLIIVDSLRQGQTLDENSNQDMASLWAIYKSWTEMDSKPAVVVLHHTSKNNANSEWSSNARGSGEIISSSDAVIEVRMDKEKVHTLHWTKHRPWEIGQTASAKFTITDKYIDSDGDGNGDEDADEDTPLDDDELGMMRIIVKATTILPGEGERSLMDKILKFIESRPAAVKVTTILEITNALNMAKGVVMESLQRARAKRLIKFKRTKHAKGYVLSEKPTA